MTLRILSRMQQQSSYDLTVIGAGPAGLTAAVEAAATGARVLVVDENSSPGGQIYRGITRNDASRLPMLGKDYWRGRSLTEAFSQVAADYAPGTAVWSIEHRSSEAIVNRTRISLSQNGAACFVESKAVILATGAMERPMPVPGWTLPGVMTAGAAQIALKSAGIVPGGRIVLAGCGPLLYLLAAQLLDAGADIAALLDTTDRRQLPAAFRYLPEFVRSPYFGKGLSLFLKIHRSIKVYSSVTALRIDGKERAEAVVFRTSRGEKTIVSNCVLLHQGVVPNTNLAAATGCTIEWNERQRAFQPMIDNEGRTSLPGIFVAGDGGGIGGAQCAEISGRIAALAVLRSLGLVPDKSETLSVLKKERQRYLRGRAFLDILYQPASAFRVPEDPDTIVCRCEEVRAGVVRTAISLGVPGPNQIKTFTRCGMGPCQGRMCALTVSEIMAAENGVGPAEVGTYRFRSPVKPLRVSELASLPASPEAMAAVTEWPPENSH